MGIMFSEEKETFCFQNRGRKNRTNAGLRRGKRGMPCIAAIFPLLYLHLYPRTNAHMHIYFPTCVCLPNADA